MDDSPLVEFKYAPLGDSSSEIRLLELLELGQRVICRLTAWSLRSAPLYYALSYTWGESAFSTQIIVNDEEMTVGANCGYALRQAYASESCRYLWIDAICIDQTSTQEKTHQVAMMGRIYTTAAHVFACVGPHADGSEFFLETMNAQKSLLASIHKHVTTSDYGSLKGWNIPNPIPTPRWLSLRCFSTMNAEARNRFAKAVILFLRRPYFTRVWILQELHLATTSSFCCGKDIRPFDQLLAASLLVDFWINQQEYMSCWGWLTKKIVSLLARQSSIFTRQNSCNLLFEDFNNLQSQRGCLGLTSGARGPRRLAEVLDEMQHFQCTDLRDKLYGILSLVEWGNRKRPDPDYAKDRFEVCVMILQLYLDDEVLAPVSGTYVEWTHRLHDVFNISPEVEAMRKALETRYPSSILPGAISKTRGTIPAEYNATYRSREGSRVNFPSSQLLKRTTKRRFRNMWYGVRLHHAREVVRGSSSTESNFLCCGESVSTTGMSTVRLRKIVDGCGRLVAFAPWHIRVGDWFLVSGSSSYPTKDSIGLVLRLVDFHTVRYRHTSTESYVKSRPYGIVGQAALHNDLHEDVLRLLDWDYFSPRWTAEDLLVLEWSFFHRVRCETSKGSIADWLSLQVCNKEGSSDVNGPVEHEQNSQGRIEHIPLVRYISRPLNTQLITPEGQEWFADTDSDALQSFQDKEAFY
jgi:hypothetical protein